MLTCNKCKKEITSDRFTFQGEFKDHFVMNQFHICLECIEPFKDMLEQFLNTIIPADKPDETKILRTKRFGKKKKLEDVLGEPTFVDKDGNKHWGSIVND